MSKAQLLRANAQRADSLLAQIDEDIGRRERALRSSRSRESLVTGLDRFGDVQAPGAPVRRVPGVDERVPADSAGVPRPEATPEQRLQELQLLRFQTIEAKRQFLERAQLFEERARRIG